MSSDSQLMTLNDKPFNTDTARFYFKRKDNGKVGLYYNLSGTNALSSLTGSNSLPVPTIFRTMTDKFSNVTLNVKAQKMPVAIVGLKPDFAKGVVATRTLDVKADNFRYQDQFGNLMTAEEVVAASATTYKVAVTVAVSDKTKKAFDFAGDGGKTVGNDGAATKETLINTKDVVLASLTAGEADPIPEADITVQFKKGTDNLGEAKKFKFYAVPLAKMNSFEVKVPALVPSADVKDIDGTSNTMAVNGFEVKAVGHYAGETIELTAGTDFTVLDPVTGHVNNAKVPSLENEKTVVKRTAKVAVAIADGKGTPVEKEYTYTNERRVVKTAKVKTSPVKAHFNAAAKGWDDIKGSFEIKDQYDVVVDATPYITLSDLSTGLTLEDAKKNGTSDVKLKIATASGKGTATVKLTFNGSGYVFDQVVSFEDN